MIVDNYSLGALWEDLVLAGSESEYKVFNGNR